MAHWGCTFNEHEWTSAKWLFWFWFFARLVRTFMGQDANTTFDLPSSQMRAVWPCRVGVPVLNINTCALTGIKAHHVVSASGRIMWSTIWICVNDHFCYRMRPMLSRVLCSVCSQFGCIGERTDTFLRPYLTLFPQCFTKVHTGYHSVEDILFDDLWKQCTFIHITVTLKAFKRKLFYTPSCFSS